MAEIIGKNENLAKICSCKHCGSIVKYYPIEVKTLWEGRDYSGGSDGAEGIVCPGCSNNIVTKAW